MTPTIILPVYNAFTFLTACLDSLEQYSPEAGVILIDDASTDERVLPHLQAWVGKRESRKLIINPSNSGFVHSVNRGISGTDNDVILLNSDTLVTPGWLAAMTRCLASRFNISTVTPWSNNGEIVSFPEFCVALPVPADRSKIALAIATAGSPQYPELPTAVGFCMGVSRAAINKIGLFDEETFGRGYGEENDFCMRARKAGMVNLLCDDAYVAHEGGGSFAPLGLKPNASTMQKLLGKHPEYLELIEDYIKKDPLADRRQFLMDAMKNSEPSMR